MVRFLILVLAVCGQFGQVMAQLVQAESLELEKEKYGDYYFVISGGERGILIFRETDDSNKSGVIWDLRGYDTNLNEKWKAELSVDWKHTFRGYEYKEGHLYMLFVKGNDNKSDFFIEKISIDDGEITPYKIENDIDLSLSHITVSGKSLVLAGYIVNRPAVVLYNFDEKKVKVLPGFFQKKSDILELKSNQPDTTFNVLFSEKSYTGGYVMKIRTYSQSGNTLFEYDLKIDSEFQLLGGKTGNVTGDAMAIAGTFGSINSYYSQGMFFARISKDGKATVKYHYFSELDNFFNYMHPKRTEKIKDKIVKNRAKGKRYEFRSRLLLHELIEEEDGYLLLAEVYQPKYDYNQNSLYNDPYSLASISSVNYNTRKYVAQPNRFTSTSTEPNTYEYRQAVVLQLNKYGKIQWDESFKTSDVEKTYLQQVVALNKTDKAVKLLYKSKDNLNYKVLEQGKTIQADTTMQVKLKNEGDSMNKDNPYEELGKAEYWYDNSFFVWGYRKVIKANSKKKENVFYINKVYFE